jgi:hypothetical protein
MLPELIQKASLFSLLHRIDKDLAKQHQQHGCPYCGGPLHQANYMRKPRGGPDGIAEDCFLCLSLCCAREGCRRRSLPPSTRFMGRRVYWGCVVLVAMTLRQGRPDGMSANKLKKLFGVTRLTIKRWVAYFRDVFPLSVGWRRLRGRVSSSVRDNDLPGALLGFFVLNSESADKGLTACLHFLASAWNPI